MDVELSLGENLIDLKGAYFFIFNSNRLEKMKAVHLVKLRMPRRRAAPSIRFHTIPNISKGLVACLDGKQG